MSMLNRRGCRGHGAKERRLQNFIKEYDCLPPEYKWQEPLNIPLKNHAELLLVNKLGYIHDLPHSLKGALRNSAKKCAICGWDKYTEALVIHHINHDRSNNNLGNLMVLCRNCHYLLHQGMLELPRNKQMVHKRSVEAKNRRQDEKHYAEHMLVRDLQHRYDFHDFETVIWQPGDIALEAKLKAILGYVPAYAVNREYGYVIGSGEVKH